MEIKRSGTQPSGKRPADYLDGKAVDWMEHVTDAQYLT